MTDRTPEEIARAIMSVDADRRGIDTGWNDAMERQIADAIATARMSAAREMQQRCQREVENLETHPGERMFRLRAVAAIRALNPEEDQ